MDVLHTEHPSHRYVQVIQLSTTLQGFQQQMKNRLRVQNSRADFAAPACECIHCSWWESHYSVHRRHVSVPLAETRVGTVVWLASKTNPHRRVQKVLQEIGQTGRGERIFLALEKKHVQHKTGTRDVGDTIVVSTTVGTIKSHKVHISSTQDSQAQQ